jgi:hypothetical protein
MNTTYWMYSCPNAGISISFKNKNENNFENIIHWPKLLQLVPYLSSLNWFKDQFVTIVIYRFGRNASKKTKKKQKKLGHLDIFGGFSLFVRL